MSRFENQIIIYTGACGLIGSGCVDSLCRQGATVIAVDIDRDGLKALQQRNTQGKIDIHSQVDLCSQESVESLVQGVVEKFGRIDGVVFSSYPRTSDWGNRFEAIAQASFEQNMRDHMGHYFFLAQAVAPIMIGQGGGSLVFFSSIYGLRGPHFGVYDGLEMTMPAAYSLMKGGITNFVRYLAGYLGPHGIRANALCPGGVFDSQDPRFVEKYEARTPMGRMARPEDLVGPLEFLLSGDSAYVNGVNLPVDGGWSAT